MALWAPGDGGPGGRRKFLERDPGNFQQSLSPSSTLGAQRAELAAPPPMPALHRPSPSPQALSDWPCRSTPATKPLASPQGQNANCSLWPPSLCVVWDLPHLSQRPCPPPPFLSHTPPHLPRTSLEASVYVSLPSGIFSEPLFPLGEVPLFWVHRVPQACPMT